MLKHSLPATAYERGSHRFTLLTHSVNRHLGSILEIIFARAVGISLLPHSP